MKRQPKSRKVDRPVVIDLFAGVGGLSLGAARAGFSVSAAVDIDVPAIESHTKNFPHAKHLSQTVRSLNGATLLELAGLKPGQLDGLIGGPPCQGFSSMGHRSMLDRRNDLFSHFFRLVGETRPKFFVAENVPGILLDQYSEVRKRALSRIPRSYVLLDPIRVTASDFGVPTRRTRIFFIGYRKDAIDDISVDSFAPAENVSVSVQHALRGLPVFIDPSWQTEKQGWRRVRKVKVTPFLNKIAGGIPPGVGDMSTIERYIEKSQVSGCLGTVHAENVVARFSRLEPGEQDSISKAVRLDANGFCPTLRAGTGSERGSYQAVRPIHHREARVITPREAARLQGFPDWFLFHPTKWHSFRQIGNSVSPIVAEALLQRIAARL